MVEVLLTIAIFTITVLGIISFLSANDNNLKYSSQYNEANHYLNQALEAVKNIKDSGYSGLNLGTYGLSEVGSTWQLTGSSDSINGFVRQITITEPDAYTKKATATITWMNANLSSQSITASLYFKDWNRLGYSPTPSPTPTPPPVPCSQNTSIDITCDNEFILYVNGSLVGQDNDWQTVHNYQVTFNSGKNVIAVQGSGDFQTSQSLIAQVTNGTQKYYTDTDWKVTKNYYDGWNAIDFNDSIWGNSTVYGSYGDAPWYTFGFPSPTLSKWIWTEGLLTDSPVYFRYAINGCPVTPTPTPTPTLTPTPIYDWNLPTYASSENFTGTNEILDMVKQGDYLIGIRSTTTNNFFITNVSDPSNPGTPVNLSIGYTLTSVAVKDDIAYVTTTNNQNELRLVNISNKSAPTLLANPRFDLPGNDNGTSVHAIGDRLYVGRASSGANPEFYLYNITTANNPTLIDSFNLAGNAQVQDLYVSGNYIYLVTNSNSAEIMVINKTTESNLVAAPSYNLPNSTTGTTIIGYGNKILVSNSQNYVYAFTIDSPPTLVLQDSTPYAAGGLVNEMMFSSDGNLAFAATSNANSEFQVLNVADLTNITLYGSFNVTGSLRYNTVVYDPITDRAYLGGNYTSQELGVYRPGP